MNEPPEISTGPRASPEPEFIDEGPGSYLSELGTRAWSVTWGIVNCVLTLAVGEIARVTRIGPSSEWITLARLAWILLPLSALILVILTVWQHLTAYTKKSPGKAIITLAAAHLSLAIWLAYSFFLGLLKADS